jgi:hypothetical protein
MKKYKCSQKKKRSSLKEHSGVVDTGIVSVFPCELEGHTLFQLQLFHYYRVFILDVPALWVHIEDIFTLVYIVIMFTLKVENSLFE